MVFRRPRDLTDAADWLYSTAGELEGLSDCLNEDDGFAVAGHSFGGYTATAIAGVEYSLSSSGYFCSLYPSYWLCDESYAWVMAHPEYATWDLSDSRVWATVPMAPAGYEILYGGLDEVEVPALLLGGQWDSVTSMEWSVNFIYDAIGSEDKYLGELHRAGHSAFISICELWPESDECHSPYLEETESHAQVQTITLAFLRMVQGDESAADYLPPDSDLWTFTEGPR